MSRPKCCLKGNRGRPVAYDVGVPTRANGQPAFGALFVPTSPATGSVPRPLRQQRAPTLPALEQKVRLVAGPLKVAIERKSSPCRRVSESRAHRP